MIRIVKKCGLGHSAGGFTLLEILIAISIFAVVVATIFGSFNFVFGNVDAIESAVADHEMASEAINRMLADLRAIYVSLPPAYAVERYTEKPDPCRVVGEMAAAGDEEFGRLRFTSLSHLPLGKDRRQGIAEIIYYVEKQESGLPVLKRADRLDFSEPEPPQRNDPILCENIRALKFTYMDGNEDERERWDSDSEQYEYATPRAVRIQLAVGSGEQTHEFDVLVALPVYRENPEAEQFQTLPSSPGPTRTYRAVPQ